MTNRIKIEQRKMVRSDRTDPWADYHYYTAPFTGEADTVRMERALRSWYGARNADAPTVRVQKAEDGLVHYSLRWSLGD